jgi:hypothetical protein
MGQAHNDVEKNCHPDENQNLELGNICNCQYDVSQKLS